MLVVQVLELELVLLLLLLHTWTVDVALLAARREIWRGEREREPHAERASERASWAAERGGRIEAKRTVGVEVGLVVSERAGKVGWRTREARRRGVRATTATTTRPGQAWESGVRGMRPAEGFRAGTGRGGREEGG